MAQCAGRWQERRLCMECCYNPRRSCDLVGPSIAERGYKHVIWSQEAMLAVDHVREADLPVAWAFRVPNGQIMMADMNIGD